MQLLVEGFLSLCEMDKFESMVKPTDPFSEKCNKMRKIKQMNIETTGLA